MIGLLLSERLTYLGKGPLCVLERKRALLVAWCRNYDERYIAVQDGVLMTERGADTVLIRCDHVIKASFLNRRPTSVYTIDRLLIYIDAYHVKSLGCKSGSHARAK